MRIEDRLAERLKKNGYTEDKKILNAFKTVRISNFIDESTISQFVSDHPVVFKVTGGREVKVPAPHMIALMLEVLRLSDEMNILVLGSRSGYMEALICETISPSKLRIVEDSKQVVSYTRKCISKAGYEDVVEIVQGDPYKEFGKEKAWDRLIFTGSIPAFPDKAIDTLSVGGFALAPIGTSSDYQELVILERFKDGVNVIPVMEVSFNQLSSSYLTQSTYVSSLGTPAQEIIGNCPLHGSGKCVEKIARKDNDLFVAHSYTVKNKDDLRNAINNGISGQYNLFYADDKVISGPMFCKICKAIKETKFGIYEISDRNPNVMLELGLALGLGKRCLLLTEENSKVPADISGQDRVVYSTYQQLQERLSTHISSFE